jgi:hypothetical protein
MSRSQSLSVTPPSATRSSARAGIRGDVLQAVRECIELLTEAQRQRDKTGREDIELTVEDVSKIKAALEAADKPSV